jgi:hypothetical protein
MAAECGTIVGVALPHRETLNMQITLNWPARQFHAMGRGTIGLPCTAKEAAKRW